MDHELRNIILGAREIDIFYRVRFLSMYLDEIEEEELYELLRALGANRIADSIMSDKKKVAVDQKNKSILRILWKKHIIEFPTKDSTGKHYLKIRYIPSDLRPRINL